MRAPLLVAILGSISSAASCMHSDLKAEDLPCLQELLASCETGGACQATVASATAPRTVCFESGARAVTNPIQKENSCSFSSETRVYRPNGSLCYTYELVVPADLGCESTFVYWRDASGNLVADGRVGGNGSSVKCARVPSSCSSGATSSNACVSGLPFSDCPIGDCP